MAHERVRSHRSASRRARCSQRVGGGERAVVAVLAERGERRQDSSHRGGRLRRHPDQRRQRTVAADNRRDHPQPEYVHQPVGLRDRVDARRRAELPVRDQHRRERGRPDSLDSDGFLTSAPQARPAAPNGGEKSHAWRRKEPSGLKSARPLSPWRQCACRQSEAPRLSRKIHLLLGKVQPLSCLGRSRAGPRGLTRAGAGRLQAVSGERPQTLSAGERMSRCPGSVRRSLACIVGSLSVKIKWLHAVWRRSPNTDVHSLASRMTSLDRGMANRGARSRHSPERAGRLATRNALRIGVKPEASPPARSR